MRARTVLLLPALLILAQAPGEGRQKQFGAPETFSANIAASGAQGGAAAATIQIDIQRYTPTPIARRSRER